MYSSTLTTLYELSKWLQIDPYIFAGVTKSNDSTKCGCIYQKTSDVMAEVNNKFWSRQNFEESLLKAEFVFHNIVGQYAAPVLINESKPFRVKIKNSSIIPDYLVDNVYKIPTLELVSVCSVDKSDLDNLVITFTSVEDIDVNELLFYLPQDEASYVTNPKWGDLKNQIRPVLSKNRSKNDTTYTITIPSYLCVKPSLYSDSCLPHVENTYLDNINVYKVVYNDYNGNLVSYNLSDNADISTTDVPFKTRVKHLTYSELIEPAYTVTSCYGLNIEYANYNYITGFKNSEQMLNSKISYPIYLLAAMFSIVGEDCGCNYNYASELIKQYRVIPKHREVISGSGNSMGQQFRDLMSAYPKNPADGYMIYIGFIEAIAQLNNLDIWR